jgi:hypothetical protein
MAMLKFFKFPFATLGDKTAIPDASQPSGSVSYTDGFTVDYELDPGVDPAAKDVPRDESNQLYFDITNAIKEYQEFGVPDYITSALNGGVAFSYSKYARVKWTDGAVYESRINANTDDPSVAASWRKLTENADFLAIATTAFQASVADGEAVYWTGTEFDEAVADGTNKQNVIGFADVTNGRVFVAGLMSGLTAGLTANVVYYLSGVTPGALTSVLPASNIVRMGIARTATTFHVAVAPLPAVAAATETVAGIAEIATQAETEAGVSDVAFVTPLKLRSGFAASFTTNGYIKLPAWLGGLIINWGAATPSAAGTPTVNYALAFPTAVYGIVGTSNNATSSFTTFGVITGLSSFEVRQYSDGGARVSTPMFFIALGK